MSKRLYSSSDNDEAHIQRHDNVESLSIYCMVNIAHIAYYLANEVVRTFIETNSFCVTGTNTLIQTILQNFSNMQELYISDL
jgi:hypothetical protein